MDDGSVEPTAVTTDDCWVASKVSSTVEQLVDLKVFVMAAKKAAKSAESTVDYLALKSAV